MDPRPGFKRLKRPRDFNQLAKLIVDIATGEVIDEEPDPRNPHAVAIGRLGGLKGGPARNSKLTREQRVEIAKKAAKARWGRKT